MENPVRISTKFVVENARYVKINKKAVLDLAYWITTYDLFWDQLKSPAETRNVISLGGSPKEQIEFLFILDSINFCFWSKKKKWNITYDGRTHSGSVGAAYAIKRFFEQNPKKANPTYFSLISYKEFRSIFNGRGELLLLKERWKCVRELCKTLLERYDGDVVRFVASAEKSASQLLQKIYLEIPYFCDIHYYEDRYRGIDGRVWFLKRAQLLIADIWGAFGGKGIGYFHDIEYLTAFADYKIPQILHHFGVLEYAPKLEEKIKNKIELGAGSKEEVEIRACTVQAVENIVEEVARFSGLRMYPITIDRILWCWSHQKFDIPHHRTKGQDY